MAGFGLLAPLFLLGSLAVAIPIALHLLRQRADPVQPFSAVQLLQHSRVEQARRRRLRDVLLFALRAAALIVLAVAFARPYLRGVSPLDPPVTVVVAEKGASCVMALHVRDLPVYDYREALRPPTRFLPLEEEEDEEEG